MPEIVVKRELQGLRVKMTLELSDKLTLKFGRLLGWLAIATLLIAMGYGGGRPEMGQAIGGSGDGGIDGMIKEDALGLDIVYVQAKRYAEGNTVGRSEVQSFAGSLDGVGATIGLLRHFHLQPGGRATMSVGSASASS